MVTSCAKRLFDTPASGAACDRHGRQATQLNVESAIGTRNEEKDRVTAESCTAETCTAPAPQKQYLRLAAGHGPAPAGRAIQIPGESPIRDADLQSCGFNVAAHFGDYVLKNGLPGGCRRQVGKQRSRYSAPGRASPARCRDHDGAGGHRRRAEARSSQPRREWRTPTATRSATCSSQCLGLEDQDFAAAVADQPAEQSRKKRSISRAASGPLGSV